MNIHKAMLLQTVLTLVLTIALSGCQAEERLDITKDEVLTSPYRDMDYYVSCLWPDEKAAFFASLREKGFQATIAGLEPPASAGFAQVRGGGRSVTPLGYMSWDEYAKYTQRLHSVTSALKLSAGAESSPVPSRRRDESPPPEAAIRQKLTREIKKLCFTDMELRDILTYLGHYSDVDIQVNWRALGQVGIEATGKFSMDYRDITVKHALDLVLTWATGNVERGSEPRYVIQGEVLLISTRAEIEKVAQTRPATP